MKEVICSNVSSEEVTALEKIKAASAASALIFAYLLQTNPVVCESALNWVAADTDVCPGDDDSKPVKRADISNSSASNGQNEEDSKRKYEAPQEVERWRKQVEESANRTGVDSEFMMILLELESKGDPDAVSHVGAQGLMQIMPTTAPDIAGRIGVDSYDIFEPETNIRFAAEHIRWLIEDVGVAEGAGDQWPLYVAASYNFGHGASEIIASGKVDELPEETRNYANNALRLYSELNRS